MLSLVIPGAGQMYKGKVGAGIMWLVAVVLGYMAFIAPGLILHLVCILNAASGGAVSGNVQKSTGATHTQLYILLGILLFVIFLASQSPMFGN